MNLTPRAKFTAAVLRVCSATTGWAPYFGVILQGLVRAETKEVETMAVSSDGVLSWNPLFVEQQSVEVVALGLMHECLHVMLKHSERAKKIADIDHVLANIAMDASINEELRKISIAGGAAVPVPSWFVVPETLNQPEGWIWERRYHELKRQQRKHAPRGVGAGACGSCSGGEPSTNGEGRSEAEMERLRKETAAAVRTYAARRPGALPSSLARWADDQLAPPKIDWRVRLGQIVRTAITYRAGAMDHTWRRLSRRQGGLGYGPGAPLMSATHSPVPRVMVAIDTSGSMGAKELEEALAETQGVLASVGAPVVLCACDAAVHTLRPVSTIREALACLVGGGGTDFKPIFSAAVKQKPPVDVLLVMTDGAGPAPEIAPPFRTVWCLIGGATSPASWGDVVLVERET